MEYYQLAKNEVLLERYEVKSSSMDKMRKNFKLKKVKTRLLLTNQNVVFITKKKRLFEKATMEAEAIGIEDIKVYQGMPYAVRKGCEIEIYFEGIEKVIHFKSLKDAKKFFDVLIHTASGHSKFVRFIQKAKSGIANTSEALGIDIVGGVKETAIIATTVAAGGKGKGIKAIAKTVMERVTNKKTTNKHISNKQGSNEKGKGIKALAKTMVGRIVNQKESNLQISDNHVSNQQVSIGINEDDIEKLTKLKGLLDSGAITQEEYDKMKKDILHT